MEINSKSVLFNFQLKLHDKTLVPPFFWGFENKKDNKEQNKLLSRSVDTLTESEVLIKVTEYTTNNKHRSNDELKYQ